jgi:hypothetical protein
MLLDLDVHRELAEGGHIVSHVNYDWIAQNLEDLAPIIGPDATGPDWAGTPYLVDDKVQTTLLTVIGLAYNTDMIDTPPESYEDLLDPRFAGQLGVSDRIVSRWEKGGGDVIPRPVNQAALDTLLARSDANVHGRFAGLLSVEGEPLHQLVEPEDNPVEAGRYTKHPNDGKLMAGVPEGIFLAGKDNEPTWVDEFSIDVFPTTNADYARFCAATGHPTPRHWEGRRCPRQRFGSGSTRRAGIARRPEWSRGRRPRRRGDSAPPPSATGPGARGPRRPSSTRTSSRNSTCTWSTTSSTNCVPASLATSTATSCAAPAPPGWSTPPPP